VDLDARPGELVSLLGPSGCGKTTTLRCIAGFIAPDAGDILADETSILSLPLQKRNFGVVFQNYALFPHLTVAQNVAYGLEVRRVSRAETQRRVADALDVVGLRGLETRLPRALSGGQQQRVALARALVIRPRLLLLDEPLANLDARLRTEMCQLIRHVQQTEGITAFYVTHDQAEAMALSDRVAVMQHGRVAQFATPRDIYRRPVSAYVARFTGEASCLSVTVAEGADGRYAVRLGDTTTGAAGPPGLTSGAAALLMVRPEAVSIADAGLPATVRSSAFTGPSQSCETDVLGQRLDLIAPPGLKLPAGACVHLRIDPDQAWLIPA
jgi:ABC-type Fe3+/spermidine/putrescine transport system ATPase subunit